MRRSLTASGPASALFLLLTIAPSAECQEPTPDLLFTSEQLDNLLAPIALYPDPLLAQVLLAATFPDQLGEAAGFVRTNSDVNAVDTQSWEVSVKSVAHYPSVLNMLAEQLDWATALGQAYVNQPEDVMDAVQRLRAQAEAAGNLQSDAQMQVVEDDGDIQIWPAQALYLYVPEYDPAVVYTQRGGFFFGAGFFIGAWLNCDVDWHAHKVFYHGWNRNQGWIERSRPFVHTLAGTYVNDRYRRVPINRAVVSRSVNYSNLNRYESVHRDVGYGRVHPDRGAGVTRREGMRVNPARNTAAGDAGNRGRGSEPAVRQPDPGAAVTSRQERSRPFNPPPAAVVPSGGSSRPPERAIEHRRPPLSTGGNPSGNSGGFNTRDSGQRGQESRRESPRPAPVSRPEAARPAPARSEPSRPAPAAHEDGGKKR